MNRQQLPIVLLLLSVLLFQAAATEAEQRAADKPATAAAETTRFSVGLARVDITPDYPIRLNGFGFRRAESEGVRQRIWAKAMAISVSREGSGAAGAGSDQTKTAVLIAVDTLCIPDWLVETIAARLKKVGVARDRLAITATHTHTGPMIRDVAPTIFGMPIPAEHQVHIDQYSNELTDRLEQVALAALADLKPAKLEYAVGTARFAMNRRTKGGPVDHDLPMLTVKDPDGKLRAIYLSYACHCVTLSDNLISGDWAGYTAEQIEQQHAGCVALVSVGCGADSNPSSGVTGAKAEIAQAQGAEIATEVGRLLAGPLTPITGPITARLERIELPLASLPTREEWEERAKDQTAKGHHARTNLARLERGEALMTSINFPIQSWSFGESLAMLFLPGEVVVDYSKRLKSELDGHRLWINAYTNGCPGYVPSERILKEGGYEGGGAMVYYDIPAPYAPGLEQKIVDVVLRQLRDKFAGESGASPRSVPGRE